MAYADADIEAAAVSLMLAIGRNHAFARGNKRTAFLAMLEFLHRNGCQLKLADTREVADLVIDTLEGRWSEESLQAALRPFVALR